jgi:hypothetical protein
MSRRMKNDLAADANPCPLYARLWDGTKLAHASGKGNPVDTIGTFGDRSTVSNVSRAENTVI